MLGSCSRRLLLLQDGGLLTRWACAGLSSTWLGQEAAAAGTVGRTFASKPNKSKKKHSLQQEAFVDSAAVTQQQQHQHTQRPATAAVSSSNPSSRAVSKGLAQPKPLVLPDPPPQPPQAAAAAAAAAAVAAPRFGRVPPSSAAAAAAAAAALRPPANSLRKQTPTAAAAADLNQQQGSSTRLLKHRTRRSQPSAAAAAAAEQEDSRSAAGDAGAEDVPAPWCHIQPRQHVLPWEVVDALPQTSPFRLEALATGGIRTYMAYLRAAQMGWPTVFDLGIAKEQGYWGRRHLLQRERLLELLLQHLQATSSNSSGSSSGSDGGSSGSAEQGLRGESMQKQQHQQQQQDVASTAAAVAAAAAGGPCWEPSDEVLEGLSEEHIGAAAAAAAAVTRGPLAGAGVTPDDVSQCLVDYFLFKRCMETLLLKRQYRQAVKAKHHALLEEYQKQQQQQQEKCSMPITLLSLSELSGVTVWDAFVDVTLQDYALYLHAAGQGAPSVFNTSRDAILDEHNPPPTPQQQQVQQQQDDSPGRQQAVRQYQEACYVVAAQANVLAQLHTRDLRRPGHLTAQQLASLAVVTDLSPGDVVTLFEHFHGCTRKAFREVLEELLTAAGLEAASNMGRF